MCENIKVTVLIHDSQGSLSASKTENLLPEEVQEQCLYYNNGICATANSMSKCNLDLQGCRNTNPVIKRVIK